MFRKRADKALRKHKNDGSGPGEAPLPSTEENVTAEGQPGTKIGDFTYPFFEAKAPPEADDPEAAAVRRQVVIVGADPTGLTLALTLVRQGIAVTLIDQRRTLAGSSRWSTWTDHSLELWARAAGPGVATALLKVATPRRRQDILVAGSDDPAPRLAASIEVDDRFGCLIGPVAVHLQQYRVEQALYDALQELPNVEEFLDVRWQTSVDDITVDEDGVTLKTSVKVGSKVQHHDVPAVYCVVCAPAVKGVVRERTATPQPQVSTPVFKTVLTADLQLPESANAPGTDRRLYLSVDAEGVGVQYKGGVAWIAVSERRQPGGQVRIDAVLPAGADLTKAARADGAKELARSLLGKDSHPTLLSCLAQQFRPGPISKASKQNRLFFCGDALAVLTPFGGAGGNLGIQDAANLAWKLALVVLQGAPQALLETYQLERNAAHFEAAERQARGDFMLAPTTTSEREVRQAAVALARAGYERALALLAPAVALPHAVKLSASPLILSDARGDRASPGAPFPIDIPGPGGVFADASVEDLEVEDVGAGLSSAEPDGRQPSWWSSKNSLSRGYLIGHTGAFFTLVVFVLSIRDIPWTALKALDRSRLQLTLELVRKVVILLDASSFERESDIHVQSIGRARRVGVALLADRGGCAAAAYDARPGSVVLLRPDLCVAARWRELRPREVHDAFLQSTGHLLHSAAPTPPIPGVLSLPLFSEEGVVTTELLATLAARLAQAPAERRLVLAANAVVLLAGQVGSASAVVEALEIAAAAAGGNADDASSMPRGNVEVEKPDHGGALRVTGRLARRFEEGYRDTRQAIVGFGTLLSSTGAFAALSPVSVPFPPASVQPDITAEALAQLLSDVTDANQAIECRPPPQGLPRLCKRLAVDLSQVEGVTIKAEHVFAADGSCGVLSLLLDELLTPAASLDSQEGTEAVPELPPPSARGDSSPQMSPSPTVAHVNSAEYRLPLAASKPGEVLLVGPCTPSWRSALEGRSVRRFDPPEGEGDYALLACDVIKQIGADTAVVLIPLFSIATGHAPSQEELANIGSFVEFEGARREAAARARGDASEPPHLLTLMVDVSMRRFQLEQPGEEEDDESIAGSQTLSVLSICKNSIVIGDMFGELSAAPGLQVQFAAAAPDRASFVAAAATRSRPLSCQAGALTQGLAAVLSPESGVLESLRRQREVLCDALEGAGLQLIGGRPRAGRFVCASLPEDIGAEVYCEELAKFEDVIATEGSIWGLPGCIRLFFGGEFERIERSVPCFLNAMREIRQQGRTRPVRPPSSSATAPSETETSSLSIPSKREAQVKVRDAPPSVLEAVPDSRPPSGDTALAGVASDADEKAEEDADNILEHPVALRVSVGSEEHDQDPDVQALLGEYFEDGQRHGRPSYRRMTRDVQVLLYFHKDHGSKARRWCFAEAAEDGRQLAFADSKDDVPPVSGWKISSHTAPAGSNGDPLIVEVFANDQHAGDQRGDKHEESDEADADAMRRANEAGSIAPLATQLRQGARGVACVAQLSGSITTELIAQAGVEIVIVDSENGPGDVGDAAALVRSAVGAGAHTLFRLSHAEIGHVRRALEAGAEGFILPGVQSLAEAEAFGEMVRTACKKLRDDDAVEWQRLSAIDGGHVGDPSEAPQRPRPLVGVEVDPWCPESLQVAQAILTVEAIDMVLLDPETSIEVIAAEHGLAGHSNSSNQVEGGPSLPDKNLGQNAGAQASLQPQPQGDATPRTGLASQLRAPGLAASRTTLAAASPSVAAAVTAAQEQYWADFDAMPKLAAERRRLIGCSSHSRTKPFDLLVAGHSMVVLAADLVLLREGAARHAGEMKSEGPNLGQAALQKLSFATPLESSRARLASGALVSQLRRQKKALGAFLHLGDPMAAELVALGGFEAVVVDHEQGPGDLLNAITLLHAAASAGSHALLRVPGKDHAYLRRALQTGVEGVIFPRTETAEQAASYVELAKRCWPSSGLRGGAGPCAAALRPPATATAHLRRRGEELLLKACQVETELGVANVPEIAKVNGVDMVFFAPVELAASAGRGQEAGLLAALETAEAAVKRAGKLLGGMSVPGRSPVQMFRMGYDLVCTTSDVILIRSSAENIVMEAKPPVTGPQSGLVKWITSGRFGKITEDQETLVTKLKKNRKAKALGVMSRLGSPLSAELAVKEGFEVVVIDHSRGPGDLLGAVGIIHAAARAGAHAMIRVPALSHAHLRRALQVGVEGVILPRVEDASEAELLVQLCLYPTEGYRDDSHVAEARRKNQPFRRMDFSFAPPLVEFYGQRVAEFARRQGESVLIAAQVDTAKGAEAIGDIVKVQGIDMIFLDASYMTGADIGRVEAATKKAGLLLGGQLVPGCNVEQMFRAGYRFVCAASDCTVLAAGARMCLRAARGIVAPPPGHGGHSSHNGRSLAHRKSKHNVSSSPSPRLPGNAGKGFSEPPPASPPEPAAANS